MQDKDHYFLPDEMGIGGDRSNPPRPAQQPNAPVPEVDEMEKLVRALRAQGAEIVFPGVRRDGEPRKF
jgi:hypothetical protein